MIEKRSIIEYIEDNGKPYTESEVDFLKGFRMGQQFQKTDILEAIKIEMLRNQEGWRNYADDPDQVKVFSRRLELLDFIDINSEIMNELNYDLSTQMELVDLASKRQHYSHCSYSTMEICFENHIDVFRFIEKGLAISIHDFFKLTHNVSALSSMGLNNQNFLIKHQY